MNKTQYERLKKQIEKMLEKQKKGVRKWIK